MNNAVKEKVIQSDDPMQVPRRIAVFPKKTPVRFESDKPEEKLVMSFPNLIIREVICFQVVVIVLALISLFFNAPLEGLANPQNTPNPAKAPWYFLGLQEMLHSFPPIFAGVILPALVIIALVIIPYFSVNISREGLWTKNPKSTFLKFTIVTFILIAATIWYDAFTIAVPTFIVYILAVIPYFKIDKNGWILWLSKRSLAEWIMSWFVFVATILTVVGTLFRGPGWSWITPW